VTSTAVGSLRLKRGRFEVSYHRQHQLAKLFHIDEISTGKASSLAEIAAREGFAVRYVGRLIRLAFLAPDIVQSIVQGRQPNSLTAEALTRRIELPLEWRSQKAALNRSTGRRGKLPWARSIRRAHSEQRTYIRKRSVFAIACGVISGKMLRR
jgi:hypothetical protein